MRSMTAFSAAEEKNKFGEIKIAIRSFNFKYLEISFYNFPQQTFILEEAIREEIRKKITRGKIEIYFFQGKADSAQFQINKKEFSHYARQLKQLASEFNLSREISAVDILSLPGVVSGNREKNFSKGLVVRVVKKAINNLIQFKQEKGEMIKKEFIKNIDKLSQGLVKIKKIKENNGGQEEAKEDISEEVALIGFYLQKLRQVVESKKQKRKGKAVDFLSQELLRELNAAASKTREKNLANLIVEAKTYLGRIREQAQNVE